MTTTVNLIGAGRVGRTLLRLLASRPEMRVQHVASGSLASARAAVREAGAGRAVGAIADMAAADVWFLTVPDARIAEVAAALAQGVAGTKENSRPCLAVHCSGYHPAAIMEPLAVKGWRLASAHPMQSFADPEGAAERFRDTWVALEGEAAARRALRPLLEALGARTFHIASESKVLYHAAAVFTSNFTTVLQALALDAWDAAGVPEDVARALNASLLASTLENIGRLGPAEALTGPAARGDRAVVRAEADALRAWQADAGEVYEILSAMAGRLKASGRTGPAGSVSTER